MPPISKNGLQHPGWAGLPTPCPLCRRVFGCPFDERYREECLDFWPLGQVQQRDLQAAPGEEHFRTEALSLPWVRPIIEKWESGGQVTDEEYLRLRGAAFRLGPQMVESVYLYVLRQLLRVGLTRHTEDAIFYYGLQPRLPAWGNISDIVPSAADVALFIARDDLVDLDASAPVISHFERVVYEIFRLLLRAFMGVWDLTMPEDDEAFQDCFETEWARAMSYGNGYYGLTVIPVLSIEDMVRYQQLGGRRRAVSRSMVEYLTVMMDVFPLVAQLAALKFRDVAIKPWLMSMFDGLVYQCAWEAAARVEQYGEERKAEAFPARQEEFRATLSTAIDEYRFMHGKVGGVPDAVGMLGMSASPELRQWVELVLQALGLPIDVRQLVHVNATNYFQARLRAYLRKNYPYLPKVLSLDEKVGEGQATIGDFVHDDPEQREGYGAVMDVVSAFDVDGIEYLYIDQMAHVTGVTVAQLDHWDREGLVQAKRVGDLLNLAPSDEMGNWRAYPNTASMIAHIHKIAERKERRHGHLAEDEFTRSDVARALSARTRVEISTKRLQRWEKSGKAKPTYRSNRPIYTRAEIVRLADLIEAERKKR